VYRHSPVVLFGKMYTILVYTIAHWVIIRHWTYPFVEDIISLSRPQKRDIISYPIWRQKLDRILQIYPSKLPNFQTSKLQNFKTSKLSQNYLIFKEQNVLDFLYFFRSNVRRGNWQFISVLKQKMHFVRLIRSPIHWQIFFLKNRG
jgi:hypothetical protein